MIAWDWIVLLTGLLLAYAWLAYPALAWLAAGREPPAAVPPSEGDGGLPFVTVLIAAYNEAGTLPGRIANLLATDYPPDRWRALIGLDGGTDGSVEAVHAAAGGDARIAVRAYPVNRGKIGVLRDLAAEATVAQPDGVLAFSDANTRFRGDALRRLVAPLTDSKTGAVCGRLVFRQAGSGVQNPEAEGWYWRQENRLKAFAAWLDSCLGANGGIYAMRAGLFWQAVPPNTIVEDFVLAMHVREQGFRVRYAPDAVAEEELPAASAEWRRRVRIGCGDYQALWLCRRCLSPRYGWFAWSFFSHKVLRWFTPHLLLLALAAALAGAYSGSMVSRLAVTAFAMLALAALAGRLLASPGIAGRLQQFALWWTRLTALTTNRHNAAEKPFVVNAVRHVLTPNGAIMRIAGRLARGLRLCDHFVTMQIALLAGFVRFCRGGIRAAWEPTPRGAGE